MKTIMSCLALSCLLLVVVARMHHVPIGALKLQDLSDPIILIDYAILLLILFSGRWRGNGDEHEVRT